MAFCCSEYDRLDLMKFSFTVRRAHLRVLSAISSNLVAGLLAAMLFTLDPYVLTGNLLLAILFLYLAIKIEEVLE